MFNAVDTGRYRDYSQKEPFARHALRKDKLLFNGLLPVKQQWTVDSGKWTVVVSPSGMK